MVNFNGGTAPWLQDDDDKIHASDKDDDMSWFMRGKAAYEGLNRTDPDAVWYVSIDFGALFLSFRTRTYTLGVTKLGVCRMESEAQARNQVIC